MNNGGFVSIFSTIIFAMICHSSDLSLRESSSLSFGAMPGTIEQDPMKKLNELSEVERLKFVEDLISYLKEMELLDIIKEDCFENKEIENSDNCLELRLQCAEAINANADFKLEEFTRKIPETMLCLSDQSKQSELPIGSVVNSFNFFIGLMIATEKELDCPASWEQMLEIYEKQIANYDGKDAIEDWMSKGEKISDLFYVCLGRHILR